MTNVNEPMDAPKNTPATVAVMAGLLACLPLTGLVSVTAGVLGLRRARQLGGFGRGAAMFGLVLGLMNLVWWTAILGGALQTHLALKKSGPAIEAAGQFVMRVGDGNIEAAKKLCVDEFDDTRLTELFEQMKAIGVMRQPNLYYGGQVHSDRDIELQTELKFDTATRVLVTHWNNEGPTPKLTDFTLQTPPSTQPQGKPTSQPGVR